MKHVAVPINETLQRVQGERPLAGLRGVLNGTCNYVLDRMREGVAFDKAVVEAQSCGFAEADVARDLSGARSWANGTYLRSVIPAEAGIQRP